MSAGDLVRGWNPDPVAAGGLLLLGWWYVRGVRALRGPGGRSRWAGRTALFAAGLATTALALVSPLEHLAEHLLWPHMVQHLLLVLVAAPLFVLSVPVVPLLAASPPSFRRAVRRGGRHPAIRGLRRAATAPPVTWLLAVSVLWAWHAPGIYEAAVRSEPLHVLEHATLLGTSLLFWWTALQPAGGRRLARGADVLYVFAGGLQGGALGALFTFAQVPIYPSYAAGAAAWGLTALQDQQLAGLIMWIPFGTVYLVAAGALFVAWLREEEARAAAADRESVGVASP